MLVDCVDILPMVKSENGGAIKELGVVINLKFQQGSTESWN